jgi:hypothetical protein
MHTWCTFWAIRCACSKSSWLAMTQGWNSLIRSRSKMYASRTVQLFCGCCVFGHRKSVSHSTYKVRPRWHSIVLTRVVTWWGSSSNPPFLWTNGLGYNMFVNATTCLSISLCTPARFVPQIRVARSWFWPSSTTPSPDFLETKGNYMQRKNFVGKK